MKTKELRKYSDVNFNISFSLHNVILGIGEWGRDWKLQIQFNPELKWFIFRIIHCLPCHTPVPLFITCLITKRFSNSTNYFWKQRSSLFKACSNCTIICSIVILLNLKIDFVSYQKSDYITIFYLQAQPRSSVAQDAQTRVSFLSSDGQMNEQE